MTTAFHILECTVRSITMLLASLNAARQQSTISCLALIHTRFLSLLQTQRRYCWRQRLWLSCRKKSM